MFILLQSIKHYEQAADYYKGEESTRYIRYQSYHCMVTVILVFTLRMDI